MATVVGLLIVEIRGHAFRTKHFAFDAWYILVLSSVACDRLPDRAQLNWLVQFVGYLGLRVLFIRINHKLSLLKRSGSHTEKCLIHVLTSLRAGFIVILDAQWEAQFFCIFFAHDSIIIIVQLGPNEDYIINGYQLTLIFKHFNVLLDTFKALSISQIEDNDAALAISEVISGQAKVRILPLGVPNLKPHGRILDLQWQTFQVNSDGVNLILRKILVDKSNQERCLSWRGLAEHNKLILSSVASHRVNFSLIVGSRWEPLGRGGHAVWGAL